MIKLTRLNKTEIYLNPDLMKSIEETPDTVIALINGDHYLVREKAAEIIGKIIDFRVTILSRSANPSGLLTMVPFAGDDQESAGNFPREKK
jgi:flagellar protein FlbD